MLCIDQGPRSTQSASLSRVQQMEMDFSDIGSKENQCILLFFTFVSIIWTPVVFHEGPFHLYLASLSSQGGRFRW
jgi:hypothetical protein